jgi:RNA polymerase sigma-70 factor (ECF subfamily)
LDQIEEWFTAYGIDVFNYFVYRMGTSDVDDLVQETFIKAMVGINKFRGEAAPKTWLLAIARNVASDHLKKHLRITRFISEIYTRNLPSPVPAVEDFVDELYIKQILSVAIRQLGPAYQDVVVLRGILDYSILETAQILGWSESKVKTTWHRALKQLRLLLSKGGLTNVVV